MKMRDLINLVEAPIKLRGFSVTATDDDNYDDYGDDDDNNYHDDDDDDYEEYIPKPHNNEPIRIKAKGYGGINHTRDETLANTPATKFFKDYMEMTHEHPMDRNARLLGYSTVTIFKSSDHPDTAVWISDIRSLEQGKGNASKALKDICMIADEHGVTLELGAKAYGPKHLTTTQLVDWYKRYGFTVVRKYEDSVNMIRKPHHASTTDPLAEDAEIPQVVYHGTTQGAWDGNQNAGTMFFTSNREDAVGYAGEAAKREETSTPIVVVFQMDDLTGLEDHGAELQPDWGWIEGEEQAAGSVPTWIESFQNVGSFCIEPFKHEYKCLGEITDADIIDPQ